MPPLFEAALDLDTAWGASQETACRCGAKFPLWKKRCPACKAKNPFPRLLKKRARAEGWLDRKIDRDIIPSIDQADLIPAVVQQYDKMLAEVLRRPIPERQRNEEIARYLKRVVAFFPTMFKTTSPARVAREIDDRLGRSAITISRQAYGLVGKLIENTTGRPAPKGNESSVRAQADRISRELSELITPYLEALKVLLMYHNRMVGAWAPVRPILQRDLPAGTLKSAWAKVRGMVNPAGKLLQFGTAIWNDPQEKEHLQRLESEMLRFQEQVERFRSETSTMSGRRAQQLRTQRLSLRKHLVQGLVGQVTTANPDQRRQVVDRILAQKGVGGWWWRLFFGRKALS